MKRKLSLSLFSLTVCVRVNSKYGEYEYYTPDPTILFNWSGEVRNTEMDLFVISARTMLSEYELDINVDIERLFIQLSQHIITFRKSNEYLWAV